MEMLVFTALENDPCLIAFEHGREKAAKRELISFAERSAVSDRPLREYLINALINTESIFAERCASGAEPGADLRAAALSDIEEVFGYFFGGNIQYRPTSLCGAYSDNYAASVREMTKAETPGALTDLLIDHYRTQGHGLLSQYTAYKLTEDGLCGLSADTSVTFDTLSGLEYQKKVITDNTRDFIAGRPCNNVLLFGDRGTGKSSCIKAVLNMFARDGLRMIEIPKQLICRIPELCATLAAQPHKYILFLDDLSFEKHDAEYRTLKTAMEGQLQANPENVVIYATSNRRHLIKETVSDRDGGDIHRNDNMQEKLSLSERFGISLVFTSPTQKEYLAIVRDMLAREGIEMSEDIEKAAIRWQLSYGGRNPRLARQFTQSVIAGHLDNI